jgi:hypothetical protein
MPTSDAASRARQGDTGQPLDASLRARFEPLLGHDLSAVRVHADSSLPETMHAAAFTTGDDLTFAPGYFAPDTAAGQRLIAHELTHVVQNHGALSAGQQSQSSIGQRGDPAEREAEAAADHLAAGTPVSVQAAPSAAVAPGLLDWVEEAASDVGSVVSDASSAVGGAASDAWDATKALGSDIYDGMKENAGYVKQGEHWLEGGIDWLEDNGSSGAHWLADEADGIPILEQVADAGAWAFDQQSQFTGGLLKGATNLVGGVAGMIANPVDAAIGLEKMAEHIPMLPGVPNPLKLAHGLYDVVANDASLADVANRTLNPLASLEDDAQFFGGMASAMVKPYQDAIDEGKWSEAIGHGVFDIGTLILTGGESAAAEAGVEGAAIAADAARASEVASVTADAARASEAAGFAGEVAGASESIALASDMTKATESVEAAAALGVDGAATEAVDASRAAAEIGEPVRSVLEPHPYEVTETGLSPLEAPTELAIPEAAGDAMAPSGLELAEDSSATRNILDDRQTATPPTDGGLADRGYRPQPGERSLSREEWMAQNRRTRAERTVANADRPLENPLPNAATEGHGHAWHGYQTTEAQQIRRVETGVTPTGEVRRAPPSASRFGSPEAEAEALGRGRRALQADLDAGAGGRTYPDPVTGDPTYVNPNNGAPVRRTVTVETNRPDGFGTSVDVGPGAATGPGMPTRIGYPRPEGIPNASLTYEYVPSTGEWQPVTYYPERP